MRRWFAAIAVAKREPDGSTSYLLLKSRSMLSRYRYHKSKIKLPGGSDNPCEIDPVETAIREFFEETWLRVKPGVIPRKIHTVPLENGYVQHFYLVDLEDCEGELRDRILFDGTDVLYIPFWASTHKALRLIFRSHDPALTKAIEIKEYTSPVR